MKIRLSVTFGVTAVLAFTFACVFVAMLVLFAQNRNAAERRQLFASGRSAAFGARHGLRHDFENMKRNVNQSVFSVEGHSQSIHTTWDALATMNQTLFDLWAPRQLEKGLAYGFACNYMFTHLNGTVEIQSIQTYSGPLRDGRTQHLHTWTDPHTLTNTAWAFEASGQYGQPIMQAAVYSFDFLPVIERVMDKDFFFDQQPPWGSSDGNPYWYFIYQRLVPIRPSLAAVVQVYRASNTWSSILGEFTSANTDVFLLTEGKAVVASTYPPWSEFLRACAGTRSHLPDQARACLEMPADQHNISLIRSVYSAIQHVSFDLTEATEQIVEADRHFLVVALPVINTERLKLMLVWINTSSDLRRTSQTSFIVIGTTFAFTVMAIALNFVGVFSMLVPLRRAADDLAKVAALQQHEIDDVGESLFHESNSFNDAIGALISAVNSFEKYVPCDIVRSLVWSGTAASLFTEQACVALLFCDLVDFTRQCDVLGSTRITEILSLFFEACSTAIQSHGGIVDKYIGDCVMAVWGVPRLCHLEHARCIAAALEVTELLHTVSLRHPDLDPLRARLGLASGEAQVGNIGCESRFSYTVVGDPVNVASRLESFNKQLIGTSILATGEVVSQAADTETVSLITRRIGSVVLYGKPETTEVFEVIGLSSRETRDAYTATPPCESDATPADANNVPQKHPFDRLAQWAYGIHVSPRDVLLYDRLNKVQQRIATLDVGDGKSVRGNRRAGAPTPSVAQRTPPPSSALAPSPALQPSASDDCYSPPPPLPSNSVASVMTELDAIDAAIDVRLDEAGNEGFERPWTCTTAEARWSLASPNHIIVAHDK